MSDDAEFEQFVKNMKKESKDYEKTNKYKKRTKQEKEIKPIIQKFFNEEITYSELKKYCVKNNISKGAFIQVYTDILSEYDTTFHKTLDYEELDKKDKKLWEESYNNDKLLKPIRKKVEKLIDELEESDDEEPEEEKPKKEIKKEPKKETKKEVKKVEPKKEVKKETKKPIIVKLQKLCNELNEESDEE